MNTMTIEEMVKVLREQKEEDIELSLQGIITTDIRIESAKIKVKRNQLFLEGNLGKIGFNLNQLMKIIPIQENEILLEFDQLQQVRITM